MTDYERMMDRTEELLQKPYWIIDILPEQVKENSLGQYFEVERFYLKDKDLRRMQLNMRRRGWLKYRGGFKEDRYLSNKW